MKTNPQSTTLAPALPTAGELMNAPPTAGELMNAEVVTCRPSDTLNRCAQIMWDEACGCVPVVDEDGRPISIVTDRDVCMAAYIQGKPLKELVVSSAMSKRLFVVDALETVAAAEAVMRRHGVRRLLVVDHAGILVGILSFDDIVRNGRFGPPPSHDPLSAPMLAETAAAMSHRARRAIDG